MNKCLTEQTNSARKIRILVLGGGFAGYYALKELERHLGNDPNIDVTLVNRENYILFTPMLHEVAASDLDPSHVAVPLHELIRKARFLCGAVESLDLTNKIVAVRSTSGQQIQHLSYDYLVIALGSISKLLDVPGLAARAITMKSLEDAMYLRNHMVQQLEDAEFANSDRRRAGLTFVVVGGGIAGVETVAAMMDFLHDVARFYPYLRREMIRVLLVHSGAQLLKEMGNSLGEYAAAKLRQRGVELHLSARVIGCDGGAVCISSEGSLLEVPANTLVWTAGIIPAPVLDSIPSQQVKGRLLTQRTLELPQWPGVYAIGDCAAVPKGSGTDTYYGATAQNALRQGRLAARNIVTAIRGGTPRVFQWRELGQLASLGQRRAVARLLGIQFSGFAAWWLWRTIYLAKLPGIQKKIRVGFDWLLDLFFSKNVIGYRLLRVLELFQANRMSDERRRELQAPEAQQQAVETKNGASFMHQAGS
jgi:NADH:quinone reductase (non-electrogenic)